MSKQVVKITESKLMEIVAESVKRILSECKFNEGEGRKSMKYRTPEDDAKDAALHDIEREYGKNNPNLRRLKRMSPKTANAVDGYDKED